MRRFQFGSVFAVCLKHTAATIIAFQVFAPRNKLVIKGKDGKRRSIHGMVGGMKETKKACFRNCGSFRRGETIIVERRTGVVAVVALMLFYDSNGNGLKECHLRLPILHPLLHSLSSMTSSLVLCHKLYPGLIHTHKVVVDYSKRRKSTYMKKSETEPHGNQSQSHSTLHSFSSLKYVLQGRKGSKDGKSSMGKSCREQS